MNLREIECFIAVADELHFGRAARRLHLAQPTVSESVRRLERHIGGQLFDRSTRNVQLTELGSSFLEEARGAYSRIETAYEKVRLLAGCPTHAFTVGAMAGDEDLVVAATAAFTRSLPTISVQFEEMRTVEQVEGVLHARIDVGVTRRDRALAPKVQHKYIDALGGVQTLIEMDTCHMMLVSEPEKLAQILVERCRL